MTYNIAVVGIGKIARDQHLPCIAKNKNFKLAAVVSRNATVDGVPNFKSIAELVASRTKVDCVALCTPPSSRLAMAKECFEAGYHVLIEKPPTPTIGELNAMVALAKRKKRILYVTWHSRYNKSVDEAKRYLAKRKVNVLRVTWREDVNRWHPGQDWIAQPGGFGVFDPGINALSIVTKILPEPVFVKDAEIEVPSNWSTPIGVKMTMKFADDRPADMAAEFDWRQRGEQTWNIEVGTEAGEKLLLSNGGSVLHVNGNLVMQAPLQEYEMIYAKFARLLKSKRSETDSSPLQLECDAFMLARPKVVDAFAWDVQN